MAVLDLIEEDHIMREEVAEYRNIVSEFGVLCISSRCWFTFPGSSTKTRRNTHVDNQTCKGILRKLQDVNRVR
jgi:hypothetical protein